MATIPVKVKSELEIHLAELPQAALESIQAALTFENEERTKASMLKKFGWWDMPEFVPMWRAEERRGGSKILCLPRGFSMALVSGLAGMGHKVEWDDQRSTSPASPGYYKHLLLRDYQLDAVLDLMRAEQGFWQAPPAAGKTVGCLGMLAYSGQRALVVVERGSLLEQWRTRAAEFYDMPMEEGEDGKMCASLEGDRSVGKIGEDVWEERDLTIALRQTLHARRWQLDATGWWGTWGETIFDEGHHLSSDTLQEICRCVVSRGLKAVSATPSASAVKGQVIHSLIGPIVHETPRQTLIDRGILMSSRVEVRHTGFAAAFHKDHDSDAEGNCEADGCRKRGKHSHRNNYASCLKLLVESEDRAREVVSRVMVDPDHTHLVPSKQLKHLNLIRRYLLEAGWPKEKVWLLRGEENAQGLSQQIASEVASAGGAVLLSTVAGEGLDIPPIDRIHMVFPGRQELAVIQVCGRGERVAPGKTDCIAEGQRVLTDCGLVPIEQVTIEMKVWDGVCFVTHDGPIFQGIRPTITYDGLTATPEHQVWSSGQWMSFNQCSIQGRLITHTGEGRTPIREADCNPARDSSHQWLCPPFDSMLSLYDSDMESTQQSSPRDCWMQLLCSTTKGSSLANSSIYRGSTKVYQLSSSLLSQLWGSRYSIQIFFATRNGSLDSRSLGSYAGQADRQDQQRRSLRTRKFAMGDRRTKPSQQPQEQSLNQISQVQARQSRNQVCGRDIAAIDAKQSYRSRNYREILSPLVQAEGPVWDILNAGPRHRFTVEGLLVSNCVVIDYVDPGCSIFYEQFEERERVYIKQGYEIYAGID